MSKFLALLVVPIVFFSCASNNVTVDDSLGQYFDSAGVKGTFALFDNGQGRFTIYDLPRYRDSLYSPDATFDIVLSLVGFQTGVAKDGKEALVVIDTLAVDTVNHTQTSVSNTAFTIEEGFRSTGMENEVTFQKLASKIGMDTLKKWVDSLHYGNMNLSGGPTAFWLDDSLKITADEELGLTKKLYFNQLPFYRRPQELVRDMFSKEVNSNYRLVYKIARFPHGAGTMGWVMGWVEENKHPYFFVLNIDSPHPDADISAIGLQLVKRILASEGFFQGKK